MRTAVDPRGQLRERRDPVRDAGGGDLLLGPRDPGRHRRLAHQEGPGDLCRGQPAEQAEGERHLRVRRERRVAAGEDQAEPVVHRRTGRAVACGVGRTGRRARLGPSHQQRQGTVVGGGAPCEVDGAPAGHGRQPGAGPGGDPGRRPGGQRPGVGVLDALLGDVEVAGRRAPSRRARRPTRGGARRRRRPRPRPVRGPSAAVGSRSVEGPDRAHLDATVGHGHLLGDRRSPRRGRPPRSGSSPRAPPSSRRRARRSPPACRPRRGATTSPLPSLGGRCRHAARRRCSRRTSRAPPSSCRWSPGRSGPMRTRPRR